MTQPPNTHPAWEEFANRHRRSPLLVGDTRYALSSRLIDILGDRKNRLLDKDDVAFEKDLNEMTGGGGYFQGAPFSDQLQNGLPFVSTDGTVIPDRDHERLLEPHQFIPRDLWEETDEHRANVLVRQRAYVAWLVCNQSFRAERDFLYADLGSIIKSGRFPRKPTTDFASRSEPSGVLQMAFISFYRRWGLSTLTTWDLPLPLGVERRDASSRLTVNSPGTGMVLFVPWYALRDRQLDLHTFAGRALRSPDLQHLASWFKAHSAVKNRLGYVRLGHQYDIYRNLILALRPRYGNRLRGNTERIDRAFADFQGKDAESIRKARQELTRKLGSGPAV